MGDLIAFDRASVRTMDNNGFMHVKISPFTKEQVAPYYGREIPGYRELGLDPDKIYYGYRPAGELSKPETVASINGIPVQLRHHAEFADAPARETRVGATGTDAEWRAPYLMNSLTIFDADAQKAINSGALRELSMAYHYRPEMKAGEFNGQHYDFIMRDIRGNHLALVEEGRAGADVLVYDSKPGANMDKLEEIMAKLAELTEEVAALKTGQDEEPADGGPLSEEEETALKGLLARYEKYKGQEQEPAADEEEEPAAEPAEGEEPAATDEEEDPAAEPAEGEEVEEPAAADEEEEAAAEPAEGEEDDLSKMAEWQPTEDECKMLKDAGYDSEPLEFQRAFADGVKYGEEKMRTERGKLDKEHESEGEKKALGEDAKLRDSLNRIARGQVADWLTAAEDVKPVLGKIKLGAFDSAADVYLAACKEMGVKATRATARDVFRGVRAASKKRIAADARPAGKAANAIDMILSKVKEL